MELLLYILLLAISLPAIALNVLSLPGNWLMFLAAVGVSLANGWHHPHWFILLVILVMLLIAEGVEFFGGMIGARKFGASRLASWAAIAGAMVGGLIGIPPITAAMLGMDHLLGAVAGAFIAAWVVEVLRQKPLKEASRAALGAALGRGAGIVTKIGGGLMVWLVLAVFAFPWW
jgi:uncharacterized protein YqgC (DUF456 family)